MDCLVTLYQVSGRSGSKPRFFAKSSKKSLKLSPFPRVQCPRLCSVYLTAPKNIVRGRLRDEGQEVGETRGGGRVTCNRVVNWHFILVIVHNIIPGKILPYSNDRRVDRLSSTSVTVVRKCDNVSFVWQFALHAIMRNCEYYSIRSGWIMRKIEVGDLDNYSLISTLCARSTAITIPSLSPCTACT